MQDDLTNNCFIFCCWFVSFLLHSRILRIINKLKDSEYFFLFRAAAFFSYEFAQEGQKCRMLCFIVWVSRKNGQLFSQQLIGGATQRLFSSNKKMGESSLLFRHTLVVASSFCCFFFVCLKCEYPMWGLFTCMELTCLLLENNKYCKTILTSESVKKVWKWLIKFYKKN